MWAISQGSPATKISHFERMGLDGLSLNSLILTREQVVRGREGNSLLVHTHHHTLARPLFFLYEFLVFSLIFHPFSYLFFSRFISRVFLPPSFVLLPFSFFFFCCYCAQLRPFLYCLSWRVFIILPINCFCPGIGVLPRPPTDLTVAQPSQLTCVGRATFHSQIKEFYFVFLLSMAIPSE